MSAMMLISRGGRIQHLEESLDKTIQAIDQHEKQTRHGKVTQLMHMFELFGLDLRCSKSKPTK